MKQGAARPRHGSEDAGSGRAARFARRASDVPFAKQTVDQDSRHADLIVLSPDVRPIARADGSRALRGVPVIGEVELAARYLQGPVIGITGSNGKTTTTALTGHILRECGVAARWAAISARRSHRWSRRLATIVERAGAFQLSARDHLSFPRAIGACLNVTPDHLDRHHTFEAYAARKARLVRNPADRRLRGPELRRCRLCRSCRPHESRSVLVQLIAEVAVRASG